jgi:TPR repeat protein
MNPILGVVFVLLAGTPPTTDLLSQAGVLWERCAAADPDACYKLDSLRTVRIADPEARVAATQVHEAACAAGTPAACFALGMHLDDDGGIPIDGERAFKLFSAACEAGFAPACQRTSVFYRVSVPSFEPGAKAKASALLRKACGAGLPGACVDLAEAGRVGGAVPVDDDTAAELLAKGCASGSFRGCVAAAERLLPEPPFACDQCEPNAIERGDERCINCELAQCRKEHCCPTCEGRDSYACCCEEFDASLPYPLTTPVVPPAVLETRRRAALEVLKPAVERLEVLCSGGFEQACRDLSRLYSNARLPLHDETKAARALERGNQATSWPSGGATRP